jgi:hypothetical protein
MLFPILQPGRQMLLEFAAVLPQQPLQVQDTRAGLPRSQKRSQKRGREPEKGSKEGSKGGRKGSGVVVLDGQEKVSTHVPGFPQQEKWCHCARRSLGKGEVM